MITEYVEKYFINPAIEYGIKSYLLNKDGKSYPVIYTFEMNVIRALTIIYGEKSILLPYRIDNERAFECNLLMYDLRENDMHDFIRHMNDYYEFMKNFASEKKATGLTTEIEKILMKMIIRRNNRRNFIDEEITEFDKIFNPIDGNLKRIKSLVSENSGLIIRTWESNKFELTNTQARMIAVNPKLLTQDVYHKYGYDIRTIASLPEEQIDKINDIIMYEENRKYEEKTRISLWKRSNNIVFSCGNGFVDKLMLISIAATELMIGMVIISMLGG